MVTSRWEVGFMVSSHWGSWFQGFSRLGEGGLHGYFLLGKLILWFLPTGEAGFKVSLCWGRGWVAWLLPTYGYLTYL